MHLSTHPTSYPTRYQEIAARLERAARYAPPNCPTLNNDGSLRQSVDTLLTLIHQKEKHHACL